MRADSFAELFFAHLNKHYRQKKDAAAANKDVSGKLAFVTGNEYKFRDTQAVLERYKIEIEQLDLPVVAIQSHDKEKIALDKAKNAYKLAGRPVVVQDTFWNILALRGFPGAF